MVQEVANSFPSFGTLTARQSRLVSLVAAGKTNSDAYREAYNKPNITTADACNRAWKILSRPEVKEIMAKLKKQIAQQAEEQSAAIEQQKIVTAAKTEAVGRVVAIKKTLLTLNDRLSILAGIALSRSAKHGDKTRAIEIYSKIAGDYAPQRMELTGADGQPIQTESQSEVNVNVTQLSVRDRIARLRGLSNAINVTDSSPVMASPPVTQSVALIDPATPGNAGALSAAIDPITAVAALAVAAADNSD